MDASMRYLNPDLTDRVNKLVELTYGTRPPPPKLSSNVTHAKYKEELEKYEMDLMKVNNFNMLIRNVPSFAIQAPEMKKVKVTHSNMRDTFNVFGTVKKIQLFKGNAYISFKTKKQALETHKLINNMQLGENIIKTKVI
jgi:hypothetical protein